MGHSQMAGRISEETRFGVVLGRCDVPQADGSFVTRYFRGEAIYRVTMCDEAAAKEAALPRRSYNYTMPALQAASEADLPDYERDPYEDDDQ